MAKNNLLFSNKTIPIVVGIFVLAYFFKNSKENYINPMDEVTRTIKNQAKQQSIDPSTEIKFAQYNDSTFNNQFFGFYGGLCNEMYQHRHMYNAVPMTKNSSWDLRESHFTETNPPPEFGIFSHTDILGNYRDQRICTHSNK